MKFDRIIIVFKDNLIQFILTAMRREAAGGMPLDAEQM